MPAAWYPAAIRMPGVNAAYRQGRSTMRAVVCHYTVGRDSTPIGLRGYFQWLIRRDGQIVQFAEADAVCWHAGDWNARGPGIEVEYHPDYDTEIFTDAARDACAQLVRWLHHEWGVPLAYYDGPRIAEWSGFISHRSLIQTGDWHHDWWPREDWDRMVGASQEDNMAKGIFIGVQGRPEVWLLTGGERIYCRTMEYVGALAYLGQTVNGPDNIGIVSQSLLDAIPVRLDGEEIVRQVVAAITARLPTGGSLTANQVSSIVNDAAAQILEAVRARRSGTLTIG